jgi:DNA helicase-2/ATP-dependent DNA helicase PcrA
MADIKLVKHVSEKAAIVAIGDDDQSIYSFRMAAPEGIRNFLVEFVGAVNYPLSVSRRCGGGILAAANQLIASEPGRPPKAALTASVDAPDGKYAHLRFGSESAEAEGVARIVAGRIVAGVPAREIAILVRSSVKSWAALLRPELERRGVQLASIDWVDEALRDSQVRFGIALSHLACNRSDSLAWFAMLRLEPGVGDACIDYVCDRLGGLSFGEALLSLWERGFPDCAPRIQSSLERVLSRITNVLSTLDIDSAALDEVGWGGWVINQVDESALSDEGRKLLESVGRLVDPRAGLGGFLAALEPAGKDLAAAESDAVRLMTIISSKGLTVDTAIIMGVEEGLIPSPRGDLNEERRILYVGMTRATDLCVLTWAQRRIGPTAHQGTPRVGQARMRSPLLRYLPGLRDYEDGEAWLAKLEG